MRRIVFAAFLICCGTAAAARAEALAAYSVKPPEIDIPLGRKLGEFTRVIRPFRNWTLICDEDLKARTKVCNATQSIVSASDRTVFSWSLSANEQGAPVLILRAAREIDPGRQVEVRLGGGKPRFEAAFKGCDERVCLAYLPVGPAFLQAVAEETVAEISFGPAEGRIRLRAPLGGLSQAVRSIR